MLTTIILGGITHHYIAPKLNYCNTINNIGTIQNNYIGVMVGNKRFQGGFIKGKDSACANITGLISSYNLSDNFNFMVGGYNTNFKEFEQRNMVPPSVFGVTPIVGVNYKIPLYENKKTKISLDTLFSVGIVTHGIAVTF
jgi:hypothetical protein